MDDLAADDFARLRAELAKTRGPVALGNEIQRVRSVFKYAYEAGLIDRPVRYGPGFKRPSARTHRKESNARGLRMFGAAELREVIGAAGRQVKAMILLGVNCGFGNADVGTPPLPALDLDAGWVTYPPSENRRPAPGRAVAGDVRGPPRRAGGAAGAEGAPHPVAAQEAVG